MRERATGGLKTAPAPEGLRDPVEALQAVEKLAEPSIVVLKDFHPHLGDPIVVRALRDLAHALKSTFTTVLLLSPTLLIPPELEKEISVLDVLEAIEGKLSIGDVKGNVITHHT